MNIQLVLYKNEVDIATDLIIKFWQEHNHITMTEQDALDDLKEWTKEGHRFYLIQHDEQIIGFVHLGNRGCEIDWLEDLFVLPQFQGQGIGTYVIQQVENIVKEYSDSLYIEAAARNERAIRLYQRIGFDCLNTITVRKDFYPDKYETITHEKIMGMDFEVKKYKDK